jgi:Holliday junction resolvasome RuvABC ATP-dependent DNA helicase subunit
VFRTVSAYVNDNGVPVGLETTASRAGLDEETVQACLDCLVESAALVKGIARGNPVWSPGVLR